MDIELHKITVRELFSGFQDNEEGGVVGYNGKLDIRPPYQREFVYKDKQRDAVIESIQNGFPLNVMYWSVREDGKFEVIDGQQRTISVCQYVKGDFSLNSMAFHNLQDDKQQKILDYELMVYHCSGTDSEKLEWFQIINIAGLKLSDQELRNAVYSGPWVSDAKIWFSKNGYPASKIGKDYVDGEVNRQKYLETAIKWISSDKIKDYMSEHQRDPNASALWRYFQDVISWVDSTFTIKRTKFMKGVDWGTLYNKFKDEVFDTKTIEAETARLIADDDVERKKGIYPYILTRDEKHRGIRQFSDSVKQKVYEKQAGICVVCKKHFEISEMEADHIDPWHEGGKTEEKNCQLLCKPDNRRKSGR